MENIKEFNINTVPMHKVVAVATSDQDYEMDRTMLFEHHPDYGQYTLVHGSHCSCYGFDETTWEATIYTDEELRKVVSNWLEHSYGSEAIIAPLIMRYIGRK